MKPNARIISSALVVALACSSANPPSQPDTGVGTVPTDAVNTDATQTPTDVTADTTPEDVAPADADPGYPPEPYGYRVGGVVPNFIYQGFFAPTRTEGLSNENPDAFGEVTMNMVRRSGARFAMIQIGAYW